MTRYEIKYDKITKRNKIAIIISKYYLCDKFLDLAPSALPLPSAHIFVSLHLNLNFEFDNVT